MKSFRSVRFHLDTQALRNSLQNVPVDTIATRKDFSFRSSISAHAFQNEEEQDEE